jgi:hypothetical protein
MGDKRQPTWPVSGGGEAKGLLQGYDGRPGGDCLHIEAEACMDAAGSAARNASGTWQTQAHVVRKEWSVSP